MAESNKQQHNQPNIVPKEEEEQRKKNNKPIPRKPPKQNLSSSFWIYTILAISTLTFLLYTIHNHRHPPTFQSWFLTLPPELRHHYSAGKLLKAHKDSRQIQLFAVDHGPVNAESLVLVHGLGCSSYSFRDVLPLLAAAGLRAVAVDLPGSGFSDLETLENQGFGGRLLRVYRDVREKGLFWGFDQIVENGYVPYEESGGSRVAEENGGIEMGWVLGQVIDSLALAPVHLVLHDSALGMVAGYVSSVANTGLIRSVTIVDSSSNSAAFPSWILGVPVLREVLVGSKWGFSGLLRLCCSRSIDEMSAEAYRLLLKRKGVRSAVVEFGKGLNYSFDVGQWAESEEVKDLPLQVLWSHMSSDLWIEEGRRVAKDVPRAKFVPHLGGRWPQEGAAKEVAEMISEFVLSLPRSHRQVVDEPLSEHTKDVADAAMDSPPHHHHHHDLHGHGHEHTAGYMDAYGLGQGW